MLLQNFNIMNYFALKNVNVCNINHAKECATYIYDSDVQHIDYSDHCDSGKNPQNHILYSAATVLGLAGEAAFMLIMKLGTTNNQQSITSK